MSTPAQALASRANGSLSQGPASEPGKAISSKNALKTGLTGRTVLLPSEDAALYEAHIYQVRERYNPVGDEEFALVQSLADTEWRLARFLPSKWASLPSASVEAQAYHFGRAHTSVVSQKYVE